MKTKLIIKIFCIVFLISASCFSQEIISDTIKSQQKSIILISDIQKPMWFEKIFVTTHNNTECTEKLFSSILADSSVGNIFFYGDLTAMSSIDGNWNVLDNFLVNLRKKNINAYTAIGNHDYLLTANAGEENVKKRFPSFVRTGYTARVDDIAFVLLNSIFGELDDDENEFQLKWYLNELDKLEKDTTVKIVIVGCHHSPYTNSKIVGPSKNVQEAFIPPFNKSNKCKLFVSGHAHTFQHFSDSTLNKHYLVIGGGGGLLHKLNDDTFPNVKDNFVSNLEFRMFHYVKLYKNENSYSLDVMMISEDLNEIKKIYQIDITY